MTKKEINALSNRKLDRRVRLAGTDYDRRRKVTAVMKRSMKRMLDRGKSYDYIAEHFGVASTTVRRQFDAAFKCADDAGRKNRAFNVISKPNIEERGAYKRSLLMKRKRLPVVD